MCSGNSSRAKPPRLYFHKQTLTSGHASKSIWNPKLHSYAGRCWPPTNHLSEAANTRGGEVRLSESHARSIRAAASLRLRCIIKKMERKKRLINSVRPLPPIALGSFARKSEVRLPKSQQGAPILNADWTRLRAGFLVKLRPRETRGWDRVKTGRGIVRRSSSECPARLSDGGTDFRARSKAAFISWVSSKPLNVHFKEYCIRKCAGGKYSCSSKKVYSLAWGDVFIFFVIWQTRKMSDGMNSDAANIQEFSNPTLQLTRPEQHQEPLQKVGVTFCLVNILTRMLIISKMSPDYRHVPKMVICASPPPLTTRLLVCVYVRVGVWRSLHQQLFIMSANSRECWTVSGKQTADSKHSDVAFSEPVLVYQWAETSRSSAHENKRTMWNNIFQRQVYAPK